MKTLEVGRSQALIIGKNCVRTSSDEHRHKIDFHLDKFRMNVPAGRDPYDSQQSESEDLLGNVQSERVTTPRSHSRGNLAVAGIQ